MDSAAACRKRCSTGVNMARDRGGSHLQGWAKKWAPGCENYSDKLRQKW